jgi:hypothetical protein
MSAVLNISMCTSREYVNPYNGIGDTIFIQFHIYVKEDAKKSLQISFVKHFCFLCVHVSDSGRVIIHYTRNTESEAKKLSHS